MIGILESVLLGFIYMVLVVLGVTVVLLEKASLVNSTAAEGVPKEFVESEPRPIQRFYNMSPGTISNMQKLTLLALFILTVVSVIVFDGYLLSEGTRWLLGYILPLELALLVLGILRYSAGEREPTD